MPDEPLVGRVISDYEILRELGRGGMGIVYKAHERSLQRVVALKVLPPSISSDIAFAKRFEREARFAASLSHPNIVAIYAVGKHEDVRYIAMEYIKGKTLTALIREAGRLSVARALEITLQAADALLAAHKVGMVHRDVKPDNIMIDESGRVKVMDFGLARGIHSGTQLTADGAVLGTPRYMSPEQCEGLKPDHRSDIYSLGVVLFEMLTGRTPYPADTPLALMRQIVETPLPSLQEISADVPPHVCGIVYRMAAKRPADRYDSAETLCEDIRAYLEGTRTPTPPPSTQESPTDVLTPVPIPMPGTTPTPMQGTTPTPMPGTTPAPMPGTAFTPTPAPPPYAPSPGRQVPLKRALIAGAAAAVALVAVVLGVVLWWGRAPQPQVSSMPSAQVAQPPQVSAPPDTVPAQTPVVAPPPADVSASQPPQDVRAALPQDAPHQLTFDAPDIVLDPLHDAAEMSFKVEPPGADLKGVSWYASGPISVWPREQSVYIKAAAFDLPLGDETTHKVFARLEDYGVDLGAFVVRLRNPVELLQFVFTPASVNVGPAKTSEQVSFELRNASGKAVSGENVAFRVDPGSAPVQVVRDGETTLRVSVDAAAQNETAVEARLQAMFRDTVLAELPVHVGPACVLEKVTFAAEKVLLTNAETSAEVYFDVEPGSVPDEALSELTLQCADARIMVNRISRNVVEVALNPGVRLTGLARESQMLTAWSCGRQVGALRVELLAMAYTPKVFFPGGGARLSNAARRVNVRFDVEPAGAPPEVLEAISFRADGYELAVTRTGMQEIAVSLRDSAVIEGGQTRARTVSAWYNGGLVGQLDVALAPFSSMPKVVFLAGAPRLTNAQRHAEVEFDVAPPDLPAEVLEALHFEADTYEVVVNRKGPRQLELLLGPLVRLQEGEIKEATITARYQETAVGEMKVEMAGPASVDYVEVYPPRVDLTPANPMAYVSLAPKPAEIAEAVAQRLEFVMPGSAQGIAWQRTPGGQLLVSMEPSGFALGEVRDTTLEIHMHGAVVGRLQIHAERPFEKHEVRFTPASLLLSGQQTGAQVSYETVPPGLAADSIEWRADKGLTVVRAGDNRVAVARASTAGDTVQELRVYAVIGDEVAGILPVRFAAAAASIHYETSAFDRVTFTYPSTVNVGTPATVEIQATNWFRQEQIGTLVVAVEGCSPEAPLAPDESYDLWAAGGRVISRFYRDGTVWRKAPEKIVPLHTQIEVYVPQWPSGADRSLRVPVTFNRPGTARLYLRVSFSLQTGDEIVVHANFPEAGEPDQQGLPCMTYAINVLP